MTSNIFPSGRDFKFFEMKDDVLFLNGRRPTFFEMKDDLHFLKMGDDLYFYHHFDFDIADIVILK